VHKFEFICSAQCFQYIQHLTGKIIILICLTSYTANYTYTDSPTYIHHFYGLFYLYQCQWGLETWVKVSTMPLIFLAQMIQTCASIHVTILLDNISLSLPYTYHSPIKLTGSNPNNSVSYGFFLHHRLCGSASTVLTAIGQINGS